MKSSLPLNWEHFNSSHQETEKFISDRLGSYKNLGPEALYTSHEDLLRIFSHPLVTGSFMDLGCGHGKTALLYGHLFPERVSTGMEFEDERLKVGKVFKEKNNLQNVHLIHADLLNAPIPDADTYFLYFPTGPVLDRILNELYQSHRHFRLIAIESHGDLFPRLNLENWLTLLEEIPLAGVRHDPSARIYQRTDVRRSESLLPFTLSFGHFHLLIQDEKESWLGESFGMEWSGDDRFELLSPPRTIYWKNVKKMMVSGDLEKHLLLATQIRSKGEVVVTTDKARYQGFIRKILTQPTFRLEISSGEQVEWDKILTITQENLLCYDSSSDF